MTFSIDPTMEVDGKQAANTIGTLLKMMTQETGSEDPANITANMAQPNAVTPDAAATPDATNTNTALPDLGEEGFANPTVTDYPINSPFGPRSGGHHGGVDIGTPVGTTLVSAINGTVTNADNNDPGGYGNWVEVTSPNGMSVRYGHLSHIGAKVGQQVRAGQPIGKSGGAKGAPGAGNSEGPHLHFEVRRGGTSIDPMSFIKGSTSLQGNAEAGITTTTTTPPDPNEMLAAQAQNIQDVATQGVVESQGQRATAEMPTATTSTTTTGTVAPGAPKDMDAYFAGVLRGIGAPNTPANMAFLRAFARAEGGSADNPFNTSWEMPGASTFNSHGVKRYDSVTTGMLATIKTLTNGMYENILAALRAGKDPKAAASALSNSPWDADGRVGGLVLQILGG